MTTLTAGAERARAAARILGVLVATRHELSRIGVDEDQISRQLQAGRWRQLGSAIVLHNGRLSREECERVATINCGPRAVLTSFTSATEWGLNGWGRREVHVLAPAGGCTGWHHHSSSRRRASPRPVRAAGFSRPECNSGCAVRTSCSRHSTPHRASGTVALSSAPSTTSRREPRHSARSTCARCAAGTTCHCPPIRPSASNRTVADAIWTRNGGCRTVAWSPSRWTALHLAPKRWIDDQLRQNEIVLGGTLVLRFPSVVVRDSPLVVAMQLRRALGLT